MTGSGRSRRFLQAGAIVLVIGLALGPMLWVLGTVVRVDPASPVQSASLLSFRAESLCPMLGPEPPCSAYTVMQTGAAYVPQGNVFVYSFTSSQNQSGIAVLTGIGLRVVAEALVPCITFPPIYAGAGPDVFLVCQQYSNQAGWTDSLLAFNWSRGAVVATIPVPTNYPWNVSVAYDASRGDVFVAVAPATSGSDRLLTLSLPSFGVVQNITIPNLGERPFLWTVDSGNQLELAFLGNSSLLMFDPSTSTWSKGPNLSSPVREASLDIGGQLVYLLIGPPLYESKSNQFLDLNTRSPGRISAVPTPSFQGQGLIGFASDPVHGDLYVQLSGGLAAYNMSDGDLVGSWGYWGGEPFWPNAGEISYDPYQDEMIYPLHYQEYSGAPMEPAVSIMNLTHGSILQASYTGIPWVGTAFPLLVLLLGVAGGIGLLVTGAALARRSLRAHDAPDETVRNR